MLATSERNGLEIKQTQRLTTLSFSYCLKWRLTLRETKRQSAGEDISSNLNFLGRIKQICYVQAYS